ncbi:hypothetical protein LUZ61_004619 [Rhynchospora tenuis]|uniref:F-box domain-containing protein n=1 Tax=Rhynchospora tenuis TaxID=198213 RepID=A0AAD6ETW0_9POAL|nr:hypothetical protein LUZ61_004619 [Rhynchospora tenuis]
MHQPQQPMEGGDRISSLPEEIKISILCCLEVKDAIRTSTLARSWCHLWTLLPSLRFGCLRDQDPLGGNLQEEPVSSSWIKRVYHVVSSRRGPLLDFDLCHVFSAEQSPLVQSLLDLLLQKGGVQRLFLFLCRHSEPDPVVINLPSFHSLKVLKLWDCHVILPTDFPGFNCLTTLNLKWVIISNDDVHLLIHTSKNLTAFRGINFVASEGPLSVNINLPLLRHLKFGINESVEKVSVVSAPCLEQARIFSLESMSWVTLELVSSVSMVSSLDLDLGVFHSCILSLCRLI